MDNSDVITEGDGTQPQAGRDDFRVTYSRVAGGAGIGLALVDTLVSIITIGPTPSGGHLDTMIYAVVGVWAFARADRIQREGR